MWCSSLDCVCIGVFCVLVHSHYRALVDDTLLKKHSLVAPSDYSARAERVSGVRSRTGSKRRERELNSRPSTIGKLRSATGRTTRASIKTRSTSEQGIERPRTTATTVDLDIASITASESSADEAEEVPAREQQPRGVRFEPFFYLHFFLSSFSRFIFPFSFFAAARITLYNLFSTGTFFFSLFSFHFSLLFFRFRGREEYVLLLSFA